MLAKVNNEDIIYKKIYFPSNGGLKGFCSKKTCLQKWKHGFSILKEIVCQKDNWSASDIKTDRSLTK